MVNDPIKNASEIGKQIYRSRFIIRFISFAVITVLGLMMGIYVASAIVSEHGEYTVSVSDDALSTNAISLSETIDFVNPTTRLKCPVISEMDNISEWDLPVGLDGDGGSNNGENYIAYTFYLKNVGSGSINLVEKLTLDGTVNDADEAIRVRVYKNSVSTTYAKLGADGMPEYGTVPFNETTVFETVTQNFNKDQIVKYTIVIWLEGDDPECLDNIRGGTVELSMQFAVQEENS